MAEFMTGLKRTDYCGKLRADDIGKNVTVFGWVQRQRDKGHLIFIDLRDRTGIVQITLDDDTDREIFKKAASVRSEYVLAVVGTVRERQPDPPFLSRTQSQTTLTESIPPARPDV